MNPGLYFLWVPCASKVKTIRSRVLLCSCPLAASSPAGWRAQTAAPKAGELGQMDPGCGVLVDLAPRLVQAPRRPRSCAHAGPPGGGRQRRGGIRSGGRGERGGGGGGGGGVLHAPSWNGPGCDGACHLALAEDED
jgi:hypothetical protein